MRTCPVCGLDVEDSYLFCPDDGSRLVEAQQGGEPVATDMPPDAQATTVQAGTPHRDLVVMYCGECAAEYPMTFVDCPVHHSVLISYKIQPPPPALATTPVSDPVLDQPYIEVQTDHADQRPSASVPSRAIAQPAPDPETSAVAGEEPWRAPIPSAPPASAGPMSESRSWSPAILGAEHRTQNYAFGEPPESRSDNPAFRVAAASLVVALVLFCIVAVYVFFSGGTRRQTAARAPQSIPTTPLEEQPPLIPTPAEALDYRDQQALAPASAVSVDSAHPDQTRKPVAERTALPAAPARTPPAVRPTPVLMHGASKAPVKPAMTGASITREPPLARVEQGSVDARLIRIRSMRTASGVRYDLTFDLQDESGRHAQWERLQISTRSASGISHVQAIPFVHRLGARGALTFTVSVEMRGRSEADWQGRIMCTTMGADDDGKPLRASFGTTVTP